MPDDNTLLRELLAIARTGDPDAIWAQASDNTLLRRLVGVFQSAAEQEGNVGNVIVNGSNVLTSPTAAEFYAANPPTDVAATWGFIGGVLDNQGDLSNALKNRSYISGKEILVDAGTGTNTRTGLTKYQTPFATITAALAVWASGDCVIVRAGSYNEQIQLIAGLFIYFQEGAAVNYTGSGSTFLEPTGIFGHVKIGGFGTFFKSGNSDTQSVFSVSEVENHLDVFAEDVKCYPGAGTPTTFADSTAKDAATPSNIGQIGVQLDDKTQWIGTATTVGAWTSLNAATVKVVGSNSSTETPYIKIASHSIDGVNCSAVRNTTGGVGEFTSQRITATGVGVATIDVGSTDGYVNGLNNLWINCNRLQSDQNELVLNIHDNANIGRVIYINSQAIFGSMLDASVDGISLFVSTLFLVPKYDGSGDISTTQPALIYLNGTGGSFHTFDIASAVCSSSPVLKTGTDIEGRSLFKFNEAYAQTAFSFNAGSGHSTSILCPFILGGDVTYDGGSTEVISINGGRVSPTSSSPVPLLSPWHAAAAYPTAVSDFGNPGDIALTTGKIAFYIDGYGWQETALTDIV